MLANVRLLEKEQTATFDVEYVNDDLFGCARSAINTLMPDEKLRLLDVGGGNGRYADKLLNAFKQLSVTVLEPDSHLAAKNSDNERKSVVNATYQSFVEQCDERYDIVCFNWVLHHFVGDDYATTRQLQLAGLHAARRLLNPGGLILIFENFYDGYALDDAPGRLIYELTSSRRMKNITAKLGANTAGVGVAFHSEFSWLQLLQQAEFDIIKSQHCYDFGNLSTLKKMALGIGRQHVGFVVATAQGIS